jgi:hypothetical protein
MGRGGIGGAGLVAAVAKADVENTDSTRGFVKDVKRIIIKVSERGRRDARVDDPVSGVRHATVSSLPVKPAVLPLLLFVVSFFFQ